MVRGPVLLIGRSGSNMTAFIYCMILINIIISTEYVVIIVVDIEYVYIFFAVYS